jgi:hypothetical protein
VTLDPGRPARRVGLGPGGEEPRGARAERGSHDEAVTWQGTEHVSVDEVPDPRIEEPTDAIVTITSTAICGSEGSAPGSPASLPATAS